MAPSQEEHHVICLEECHCEIPKFSFTHKYTGYYNTSQTEVASRIKDATIVIATIVPVHPHHMDQARNLKLLILMTTGMEWVEKEYCAKRDISVVNCPQSNTPAVSEHALGLYFACRKKTVEMHNRTMQTNEWAARGSLTKRFQGPPLSCSQEVMGIIGYGALGKRIEGLARGVGFGEIIVAERNGAKEIRPGKVEFAEMLKRASTVMICCPRDPKTENLIDEAKLRTMRKDACLINVARGGIVNEAALARGLREQWIDSAATDVLEVEPGVRGSPLLPEDGEEPVPNLTISPHIAWFAQATITTLQRQLKQGMEAWIDGSPINVAVHNGQIYK